MESSGEECVVGGVTRENSTNRTYLRNGKVALAASSPANQPMIPSPPRPTVEPDEELELSEHGSQRSRSLSQPLIEETSELQKSTGYAQREKLDYQNRQVQGY